MHGLPTLLQLLIQNQNQKILTLQLIPKIPINQLTQINQ